MHAFNDYLCNQLDELLKKHSVVVFYDPRREFEPFFDRELEEVGTGYEGLPRVFIKDRLTFIARSKGSFFALRAAVEPIAELETPEPLIVYVSGSDRDRHGSVLMELEKGGACYEPQVKRLARNVLRKSFTDAQIDEMLKPTGVGYNDVVSFLKQVGDGKSASVLRSIFSGAQSEALLTRWLANENKDAVIEEKDASAELLKLIEARLGLALPEETTISDARDKTARYVLINEFRLDLECDAPASVGMVPEASKEQVPRIRDVAESLRRGHPGRYVDLANDVESDLGLSKANLGAEHLGNIDTFRFEERALLSFAGKLIAKRDYSRALGIAVVRNRSFWVDRDVGRQAQWEACRLMAELGREIEKVRPDLGKASNDPAKWVQAYAAEDGWFRVDALQRHLDAWVATMDEEPEAQQALAVVRREHEELLKKMADGFAKAFGDARWAIPEALHQTRIYPEVVQTMGGRVAYFFVDAMRFEMGVELARQLEGTKDLTIRPAIAALPSITPVGMAALLPGASASFSVVEHKKKLAARIEGTAMTGLPERLRFLKAKVPDVVELPLGKLHGTSASKLGKVLGDASLVIVRSQEIDALGENVDESIARAAMDSVIGNVARAIRTLARAGIENFVVTADHGHQFSMRKDDDMKTDHPGGDTIDVHRRCWIGHGGTTPPGTVRVSGAELGYDTNLDFVFPTGLGVFKTGGGLTFHHGSISLQELVIPVVSLRIPLRESRRPGPSRVAELLDVPDKITNRTFGVRLSIQEQLTLGSESDADVPVRVVLMADGQEVGHTGMAHGAEFDRASGVLNVKGNTEASIGLMLAQEGCESIRIVVLDPGTDAVLATTGEIPVKLGI